MKKKDMDNGAFNHKFPPSHGTRSSRSSNNNNNDDDDDENNFTLASNRAMGRRFSSIETNGHSSSGCSDISNWSNEAAAPSTSGEIRLRNSTANHRRENEINYRRDFDEDRLNQRQFRHHRWTSVNSSSSVEKLPTKSYVIDKNGGLNHNQFVSTNNINDTHSTHSNGGDKAKWTHKTPINGNIAV